MILKLNIKKFRPELFFVIFSSIFGLIILFITPPFQIPDETNHFFRAYQISEGNFIGVKQDERVGGYVPLGIEKITEPFLWMRWNNNVKTNYNTIVEQLKIPLQSEQKIFVDFPNTAMYSPISYLPQSIAIFALRKFHTSPLFLFYGARIFALLFWILSVFFAIRLIPFFKWFFALITLLPMSVFINMSLSADVVTNGISFFLIAYILKLAFSDQINFFKNFIIISLLLILLISSKLAYTPIILLFFLIPKSKFVTEKNYYVQLVLLIIISFTTTIFWLIILNHLYTPYSMYNVAFRDKANLINCADMHQQINYILTHGYYILIVVFISMLHSFNMYFQGYIGTFGWLDTKLPTWFIYFSYLILFIAAIADQNRSIIMKSNQKKIILVSLIAMIFLVLLSQHLTWDCPGGMYIGTIQGRYFIPAFPLLFILFFNSKNYGSKILAPMIMIYTFFSLSFTVITLYERYYIS